MSMLRLTYDFEQRIGHLYQPKNQITDFAVVRDTFLAIDPSVRVIITFHGTREEREQVVDSIYSRTDRDQWNTLRQDSAIIKPVLPFAIDNNLQQLIAAKWQKDFLPELRSPVISGYRLETITENDCKPALDAAGRVVS